MNPDGSDTEKGKQLKQQVSDDDSDSSDYDTDDNDSNY